MTASARAGHADEGRRRAERRRRRPRAARGSRRARSWDAGYRAWQVSPSPPSIQAWHKRISNPVRTMSASVTVRWARRPQRSDQYRSPRYRTSGRSRASICSVHPGSQFVPLGESMTTLGMIVTMQAIEISETGGPEVLNYVEKPTPSPGPGEVLIKAEAIGINFIDTYFRSGLYKRELPFVLGLEVCGTVEAVGEDVAALGVGNRVVTAQANGS